MQIILCKEIYAKVSLYMNSSNVVEPVGSNPTAPLRVALRDSEALKAFAHPLRMSLYAELGRRGSATASELARALGESSGQTSYHLRQLERHGFIEDDPNHTGGRERWWRPVGLDLTDESLLQDPESAEAVHRIVAQVINDRATALTNWLGGYRPDDPAPSLLNSATITLDPEQAEALIGELGAVLDRWVAANRSRLVDQNSRRYRVHVDFFPVTEVETA